jgi:protein-disulfide isomerase
LLNVVRVVRRPVVALIVYSLAVTLIAYGATSSVLKHPHAARISGVKARAASPAPTWTSFTPSGVTFYGIQFRPVLSVQVKVVGGCSLSVTVADPNAAVEACSLDGKDLYQLGATAVLGSQIAVVKAVADPTQGVMILMDYNRSGAAALANLTSALVAKASPQNQLAIYVHGVVVSAPRIVSAIVAGNVQITGNWNRETAKNLIMEISDSGEFAHTNAPSATSSPIGLPSHLIGTMTESDGSGLVFNATAKPVVDVWEDFQCPACGNFERVNGQYLYDVVAQGKAKVVFHTLSFLGPESIILANAGACANASGKFLALHSYLFAHQQIENSSYWGVSSTIAAGDAAGLTDAAFASCVTNDTYSKWVQKIEASGSSSNINQIPTIFVNGKQIDRNAGTYVDAKLFKAALATAGVK